MKARVMKVSVVCLLVFVTASMLSAASKKPKVSTIDPITRINTRTPQELMDLTVKTLEFVEKARKSPELTTCGTCSPACFCSKASRCITSTPSTNWTMTTPRRCGSCRPLDSYDLATGKAICVIASIQLILQYQWRISFAFPSGRWAGKLDAMARLIP